MKVEQWPIDKIIPYENNPRINDNAVEKTAMSIREYGWQQPIVVDKSGVIIVGHTRLKAAKHLSLTECPVVVADLPEDKARAYRIADNKTGDLAEWDWDLLNIEIEELKDLDFDIELTGFSVDDFDFEEPVIDSLPDVNDKEIESKNNNLPTKHFAVNKTRTVNFFSLRRWSQQGKKQQIRYIQESKKNINNELLDVMANDFILFLSTFNNISDFLITHSPAGNSVKSKFNLATELSKKISILLGVEYIKAFNDFPEKNKSVGDYSKKQNTSLIKSSFSKNSHIILVDDVATTGTTMETCINLLSDHNVIPVVWVYSIINSE